MSRAIMKAGENRLNEAIACCTRAIDVDPTNAEPYLLRAGFKHRAGDVTGAIADCTKAIDADPTNVRAYNERAGYREFAGDVTGAIADCTKALESNVNSRSKPLSRYHQRAAMPGDDRSSVLHHLSVLYWKTGQYEQSVSLCAEALDATPLNTPWIWMGLANRGALYRKIGAYKQAISLYTKALEVMPPDATWWHVYSVHFGRSMCYALDNDIEQAAIDRKRAMMLVDRSHPALAEQVARDLISGFVGGLAGGAAGASAGQPPWSSTQFATGFAVTDAMKELLSNEQHRIMMVRRAEVSVTDEDRAEIYELRAYLYFQMGKHDAALADYTWVIESNPMRELAVSAHLCRAEVFATLGAHDKARLDLTRTEELMSDGDFPDRFVALGRQGQVLAAIGDYDEAIARYDKAIEVAPRQARMYHDRWLIIGKGDLYLWRGKAHAKKGDQDRAIADYTRALGRNLAGGPRYGQSYYERALAYYAKGQYGRARADVKLASKFGYRVDTDFLAKLNSVP